MFHMDGEVFKEDHDADPVLEYPGYILNYFFTMRIPYWSILGIFT